MESVDNCIVSVDSQSSIVTFTKSRNSRLTAILRSIALVHSTGRDFGITPVCLGGLPTGQCA